jgi:hypothetical protein
MNEKYYSCCTLSKNRAFWVVWADMSAVMDWKPFASGIESTREAAEAKAREVAGDGARRGTTHWARSIHRIFVAERRRQRPAKAKDSTKIEYVYNYFDWSDTTYPGETSSPEASAYRVHKTTKTRLYVEDEPGLIEKIERGLYRDHELRTFVLDRQEFEREGHARSRQKGWLYGDFYATPEAATSVTASCRESLPAHVSEAVARLDLDESTIDEGKLKRAYRKMALTLHPDQGGDAVDFRQLHRDWEIVEQHFGYCG